MTTLESIAAKADKQLKRLQLSDDPKISAEDDHSRISYSTTNIMTSLIHYREVDLLTLNSYKTIHCKPLSSNLFIFHEII